MLDEIALDNVHKVEEGDWNKIWNKTSYKHK